MTTREASRFFYPHQPKDEIFHSEHSALTRANELSDLGFNVMMEQLNLLAWKVVHWSIVD